MTREQLIAGAAARGYAWKRLDEIMTGEPDPRVEAALVSPRGAMVTVRASGFEGVLAELPEGLPEPDAVSE